jgi:hypothetical protein
MAALEGLVSIDTRFGYGHCRCNHCNSNFQTCLTKLGHIFLNLRRVYLSTETWRIDIWVFLETWKLVKRDHYIESLHRMDDVETMIWDAQLSDGEEPNSQKAS